MDEFKPGAEIKCVNVRDWMETSDNLIAEGYEIEYHPGMIIKILGKHEGK